MIRRLRLVSAEATRWPQKCAESQIQTKTLRGVGIGRGATLHVNLEPVRRPLKGRLSTLG